MQRAELKELGLESEVIDAIMKLNGQDVEKAKAENVATLEKVTSLEAQLAERDKDIKKLQKSTGDNEELSSQLKDLQAKYKADTEKLNAEMAQVKLDSAITDALAKTNARDPKDLKAFLDMEQVKVAEDGTIAGLDSQIQALQETKSYLFTQAAPEVTGTNPTAGNNNSQVVTPQEFNAMKSWEQAEFATTNPEAFNEIVNGGV
jgi:copper chaperone CopZ